MSCHRHGYPWPSLATSPYRSLPLASLQSYIPYPHIAAVCMFELIVLLLPGHMWRSIGVHHLWARPYFSRSVRTLTCTTTPGQSGPGSNGNERILHIPQSSWSLTIRLVYVIFRTLKGSRVLALSRDAVGVFYNPQPIGQVKQRNQINPSLYVPICTCIITHT